MTDLSAKNIEKAEVDQATLADFLGITARWVRQLTTDGALKRNTRGKYQLSAAVKGYIAWLKASQERAAPSDAKERLLEARAKSIELQNAEREHKLIETEEAIAALDEIVGIFRSEMDGLPARLTRDLDERKIVQEAVDDSIGHRAADRLEQRAAELRQNGTIAVPVEDDGETD